MTELLRTDLTAWEIGPYHGSLPGPMKLRLKLDGEIVIAGEVESGFLHRGLEKAIELHPWQSTLAYADHLDPEGAAFGELALCLAVEEISGIEVPERARSIRLLLSELTRVSAHLGFVAKIARSAGAETLVHYVLRDRERLLDLFELLSGARFSINFLRFGGVAADVTEGLIERVIETCELLRARLKEYNDLFTYNHTFLSRTSGLGVISAELALSCGVTGPNARASGIAADARKSHPYSGFDRIDFEIPIGRGQTGHLGDAHDRFVLRLREIAQSLEILKDLAHSVPGGDFLSVHVDRNFKVPAGEAYSRVESSRGMLGCHVISDGGRFPARVQYRAPTSLHLLLVPRLVRGIRIEDLPVLLASLDLNLAEADR